MFAQIGFTTALFFAQLTAETAPQEETPAPEAPTLAPVDEAARHADFLAFRLQLQEAVRRKDRELLLRHVAENIQMGTFQEGGIGAFRVFWQLDKWPEDSKLWQELGEVLRLGGVFSEDGRFVSPYVHARWPAEYDRFDYGVITGNSVYVRAKPIREAAHIAQLSNAIVRLLPVSQDELVIDTISGETHPWRKVGVPSGGVGYVWGKFVRSPLDYRAVFEKTGGVWRLTHFLSGE